ncbi:DUF1080 domain-containing protein [Acidobacteria bacterium AH-259-L09]|nr:DUF1080 domain-containing protein [Acidobacteria bacterium AH-259-L09]
MQKITLFVLTLAISLSIGWSSGSLADEGWISLFDGETLNGWTVRGGYATYKVKDSMIVGTTAQGSPNTFLCSRSFSDFELEFDVLCDVELNSGVQIRSHVYEKDTTINIRDRERKREAGTVYGYQVEITNQSRGVAGGIYDESRRGWLDDLSDKPHAQKAFKDGQWNHYRIVAKGDHIRTWINDIPCADLRDSMDESGFIGLQVHSVRGDKSYQVRWKNIRIREL